MTDWMFGAGAVSPLSQPQEDILREQHSALAILDTVHACCSEYSQISVHTLSLYIDLK